MKGFLGCILLFFVVLVGCADPSPTPTAASASDLIPPSSPSPVATPPTQLTGETTVSTPTPVSPDAPSGTPESASTPTAAPVSIALVSGMAVVRQSQEFSVEIVLSPRGRGISGVQVRVEYDPTRLEATGVVHGDLLGPEPVEVRIIQEEEGVIVYAAARIGPTEPPTPAGTFATLNLRVLGNAPVGEKVTLRITDVKIPDENIREIHPISVGDDLRLEISG